MYRLISRRLDGGCYHLTTIWLFTFSDLKTIAAPQTIFGILNGFHAPIFEIATTSSITPGRMICTAFWTYINLLPFLIDNQRQPASVEEDRLNKPWRPMPSKRLAPQQAKTLMFLLYAVAFIASLRLGGLRQCISLMALGYWYNDRGGAANCFSRNFINACGFVCFASGALEVALGSILPVKPVLFKWLLVIGGVVFSTVQLQDMYDQAGDRACGRQTLPLLVGDGTSRWMTALPMLFWSFFGPWFWAAEASMWMLCTGTGLVIVSRTLTMRKVSDDKTTFKIWNAWMVFLYMLPIISHRRSN
ncbi:MAG: hypothetical protein HETSPECPRED_003448 [Heterodermia speciosa]|uniref:Digeranylgeranylglyceryl phosphate synthase n=1 Tax=Heterodermia speciosa TaxID=116794 RepID=A0A8H3EET6_9LECA|nr:MAG: hypothetical protein HETSPECPRED_003448 [Heterodermia speciosa]